MTQRAVQGLFNGLFAFTDIRFLLRDTKPSYSLDEDQQKLVRSALEKVRRSADIIEEELL